MDKLVIKAHEMVEFASNTTDKEIRQTVKEKTGFSVRRLDKVTLTSLYAVYRLIANNKTQEPLALYSGAEYMSIDLFQSVIVAMENKETIRPYDFIATVGNAANFYLSKEFNIHGPNIFIGASNNILLKIGLLVETDLNLSHCQQAVIVIWNNSSKAHSCHALLVEKSSILESNNKTAKIADIGEINSKDLLTLLKESQYPLFLDLNYDFSLHYSR